MKLESIEIRASQKWEDFTGYHGKTAFTGQKGKVEIQIGDTLSRRILEECAKELIAASQQVANELTTSIIDEVAMPALEKPVESSDNF